MSRVLITGGAGFIGSHTADALIERGHQVRVLDILDAQIHGQSEKFPDYMHPEVECIRGDVCSPDDVRAALDGVDAVMHFAALTGVGQSMYDLRPYVNVADVGTATLIEAIIKQKIDLKRLVLASSRAVYGEGTHRCPEHGLFYPPARRREDMEADRFDVYCPKCGVAMAGLPTAEDRPLHPMSVYAWTKKHQEDLCLYAAETFGLPVTMLRYFNVYGTRQSLRNPYTGVVSIFYSRIKSGQPIYLYEHGIPVRDFVFVDDVVQANLLALETDTRPGICLNVGEGSISTITDVAEALAAATGTTAKMEDRGEFRVGDICSCYADLGNIEQALGYRPTVNLKDGMQRFADWAATEESVDLYQQTVDELQRHNLFGRGKA